MSVTIKTSHGDLKAELFCAQVPKTCRNFLALAASSTYNGTNFHRNIKGFMIQGGDPTGTGKGGECIDGGTMDCEFVSTLKHDRRGILSMANSGAGKQGAQFFFTYARQPHLNGVYTVFGKLIDGLDTLDKLEREPVGAARRTDAQGEGEENKDRVIVTDTLNMENGTGHFCRLTVDFMGKVDSITYLGGEELQVESLWSLVGLSETFLNHLYVRWRDGDIPDIVEFLTDEWATALFHDRFMDFCHQIKMEMATQEDVKNLINKAIADIDLQQGLSRDFLADVRTKLPQDSVKQMQDRLLEYLRRNTNHLKAYFLPENWGPGQK